MGGKKEKTDSSRWAVVVLIASCAAMAGVVYVFMKANDFSDESKFSEDAADKIPSINKKGKGDDYAYLMLGSLCVGLFFVVAYVVCEQAPCHASPWSERVYLGAVAGSLLAVLCVMYVIVWHELDPFTTYKDVVVLFVYMMQHFGDTSSPPLNEFKGPQPAARSKAAEHLGQAIVMLMSQVDAPIQLIPSMSSGQRTPPIVKNFLPFFMFLLLLRLLLHPRHSLRRVVSALQWLGVVLIILTWCLNFARYFFKKRKMQKRLINLLTQVFEKSIAKQVIPLLHCPLLLQQIGNTNEVVRLCETATAQLGASGKAVLIDALAKNGLSWGWIPRSRERQALVCRIFESATGTQLTKLKNYLDMSGDVFNLVHIYELLSTRNQLRLKFHVEEEARRVVGASVAEWEKMDAPVQQPMHLSPPMQRIASSGRLKILSDIDDTLTSSGGHFPKGCDATWPHSHCYPGVLAFYRCLDRNAVHGLEQQAQDDSSPSVKATSSRHGVAKSVMVMPKDWDPDQPAQRHMRQVTLVAPTNVDLQLPELFRASSSVTDITGQRHEGAHDAGGEGPVLVRIHGVDECNLVFLSARPHVHKDVAEAASYRVFWELVHDRRVHTVPSLLPGSLLPGLKALLCARCCQSAWRSAGMKKFSMFQAYAKLWPEYRFVFIGDNGQADVLVSELITKRYPERAAACFIHQVQPLAGTLTTLRDPTLETWAEKRIYFFGSYIGAALCAFKANLLSVTDVAEVARHAVEDYEAEYSKRKFLSFMDKVPAPPSSRWSSRSAAASAAGVPSSQCCEEAQDEEPADDAVMKQVSADLMKANQLFRKHGIPEVRFPALKDSDRVRRFTATPTTGWNNSGWWDLQDNGDQPVTSAASLASHHSFAYPGDGVELIERNSKVINSEQSESSNGCDISVPLIRIENDTAQAKPA